MEISLADLNCLKVAATYQRQNNSRGYFENNGKWMDELVEKDLITWVMQRGTSHRIYFLTEKGWEVLAQNPMPRVNEFHSI